MTQRQLNLSTVGGLWCSGDEHDVIRIAQVVECTTAHSNTNPGEHISGFTHYFLRVAVERQGRDQKLFPFRCIMGSAAAAAAASLERY